MINPEECTCQFCGESYMTDDDRFAFLPKLKHVPIDTCPDCAGDLTDRFDKTLNTEFTPKQIAWLNDAYDGELFP